MTSEIEVNEKKYMRSKDAAKVVGYTQDYVGQLARKGEVDAVRESGMWYINPESLKAHKQKAGEYVPTPPSRPRKTGKDDMFVTFDGKEYISTARGAQITGYAQDYVAQLARGGQIPSRQVGKRWYIDKKRLIAHKEENDAKLAAVQAESVGIKKEVTETGRVYAGVQEPELRYFSEDSKDLLPRIPEKKRSIQHTQQETGAEEEAPDISEDGQVLHRVPSAFVQEMLDEDDTDTAAQQKTPHIAFLGVSAAVVFLMVMGSFYIFNSSITFVRGETAPGLDTAEQAGVASIFTAVRDLSLPAGSVQYTR